jgi:hypothetical protein
MNESTLTRLKIIVERAVRPVRASTARKRKMREELLAHVSGVFEEESAKLGDDLAALERTALRFGNPAEVTSQLQESVPASDAIRRYWEGRPGEPTVQTAFRLAWVTGTLSVALAASLLVVTWFAAGGSGALPYDTLVTGLGCALALVVYLAGFVFLADWMEKGMDGPAGPSRLKVTLAAAASGLFALLWLAALSWPAWSTGWDIWGVVVLSGMQTGVAPWFSFALARSSLVRKRYHKEWGRLDIA